MSSKNGDITEAEKIIYLLAEADAGIRASTNATLRSISIMNEIKASVDGLRLTEQHQARIMMDVEGHIASTLPIIVTRLESVSERIGIVSAEVRDVAQVVVGQGEIHADTLEHVKALAVEGRDQAAVAVAVGREVTSEVKTLVASDGGRHTGAAAVIRAIGSPLAAFGELPIASQVILALLVAVAVAGWVLRGTGH